MSDPNWRRRPKRWTPDRLWRLSELLARGWDDERIGREFGVGPKAIRDARWRYSVTPRQQQAHTARRVAELLGIPCAKTVTRWIQRGWLRAHRGGRNGAHWMISHDALLDFLENPDHWHRWEPERVATDSGLRWWAMELRGGVRYLTTQEVAERCYVSHQAVHHWIAMGILPAVRGANWLVRESDLEGFVPPFMRDRTGRVRRTWDAADDRTLLRLRRRGWSWYRIGGALGRSAGACARRYRLLTEREEVAA